MNLVDLRKSSEKRSPKLWVTLETLRREIGADDSSFSKMLDLPLEHYLSLRDQRRDVSIHSICHLASAAMISLESIVSGRIDYAAVRHHLVGDHDFIPEKYQVGAFARRRSAINALSYLELFYGEQAAESVLRQLQVPSKVFRDADGLINIRFLTDMYQLLHERGHSVHELKEMGRFSSIVNAGSRLGELMSQAETPQRLYEKGFTELISMFDENWDYILESSTRERTLISLHARDKVKDSLKEKKPGSELLCSVKVAIAGAFTLYMGLPDAQAEHTKCIHRGDPECVYEIDYSAANHALKKRFTQPVLIHG